MRVLLLLLTAAAVTAAVGLISGDGWTSYVVGAVLALSLWVMLFFGAMSTGVKPARVPPAHYAGAAAVAVAIGAVTSWLTDTGAAWAIGFILWPGSKRACDPAVAAGIARLVRRRVETVGVFVNASLDEVAHAVEGIGLTHVQLHGDEGPSFCTAVGQRTGVRVIKAVRVATAADVRGVERFHTDFHLLDAAVPGTRGGGGATWEWSLIRQRRVHTPVILAGGLTPDNVADGIAAVRPWAVDVASGVEAEPGIKDFAKVEAFVRAAQGADARSELAMAHQDAE